MITIDNKLFSYWKPKNVRTNLIVEKIRHKYDVKTGHAGTLDPFAEGILLICTGTKTKNVSEAQNLSKVYIAEIKLGQETNTLDRDGEVIKNKPVRNISKNELKTVISSFLGPVLQRPPSFSALKKNNVRLYKLARRDIYINLRPRKVMINSIKFISFEIDKLVIEVNCEKGTYIRSLARDIGNALGTYAYLSELTRTSIGHYDKKSCVNLDIELSDENF
tara:strand:- start:134 stop:793 length:660 start_codon:yes stop_codon:yes gene_type:complete